MDLETSGIESHVDWRRLHALGLPSGSIRALLALLIFATTWALLVLRPTREVPDYLRDLLFIIMGHYFAARSRAIRGLSPVLRPCTCRSEASGSSSSRGASRWPSCFSSAGN